MPPADTPPPATPNAASSPPSLPPSPNQQQLENQPQQQQEQQQVSITHDNNNNNNNNNNEDVNTTQPQNDVLNLKNIHPVSSHDLDLDLDLSDDESENAADPPPEFLYVDLLAIRKEVQCPICLGIIKKTRTVMECLHRFCRDCIDKSMRMGNNECPACRTHCPSRRSLRDDPRFDELIAALYPDIKKFEEEELTFYEEDESRNKQIQDSITEVITKQTEALGRKRSVARSLRNCRTTQSRRGRRRRSSGSAEVDLDDYIDANDSDKNVSPDEYNRETTLKNRKRKANVSLQSPSTSNLSGGSLEINKQCKEVRGLSHGLTYSPEMLAWGRGGVRSTTRHGNTNGSMNGSARRIRLSKLVDFLHDLEKTTENEYMALGTPLRKESAQLIDMKAINGFCDHQSTLQSSSFNNEKLYQVAESLQEKFHLLHNEEKLSGAFTSCVPNGEQMFAEHGASTNYNSASVVPHDRLQRINKRKQHELIISLRLLFFIGSKKSSAVSQ